MNETMEQHDDPSRLTVARRERRARGSKVYRAPRLVRWGSIRELTAGGAGGPPTDADMTSSVTFFGGQ